MKLTDANAAQLGDFSHVGEASGYSAFAELTELLAFLCILSCKVFGISRTLITSSDKHGRKFSAHSNAPLLIDESFFKRMHMTALAEDANEIVNKGLLETNSQSKNFGTPPFDTLPFFVSKSFRSQNGATFGTFCLVGYTPRAFTFNDNILLALLTNIAAWLFELCALVARLDAPTQLRNRVQLQQDLENEAEEQGAGLGAVVLIEMISPRRMQECIIALGDKYFFDGLKSVAQKLKSVICENSVLYYVGGAQLCIVMPKADCSEDRIRALLDSMSISVKPWEGTETLRPIAGVAKYSGREASDALRRALFALAQSRLRGERIFWYDHVLDTANKRAFSLVRDIDIGLDRAEFRLVYQPKLRLADLKVVAVEALARWTHPKLGNISPAEFIPLIENTSLIHKFTLWVLREALQQAAEWHRAEVDLVVGVNISGKNLDSLDFANAVHEILGHCNVDAKYLDIECTESAAVTSSRARATLADLRRLGASLSLDDFGMGFSNLSCLRTLPLSTLKLDRSLIATIDEDQGAYNLLYSLVHLGHSLGFRMLAEGVETEGQLKLLNKVGCDDLQGFLFSAPVEASEIPKVVEYKNNAQMGSLKTVHNSQKE